MSASEQSSGLAIQVGLIGRVNAYIKDYLDRANLSKTSSIFTKECKELKLPVAALEPIEEPTEVLDEETVQHTLEMFDNVYEDAFFRVWDDPSQIPHVHDTTSYLKINFRLHIYFSCRKIADQLAPVPECLQTIRDFLDREGSSLSTEQDFIPFFALPFVSEPQAHPTFKTLFEAKSWSHLRDDLENYLNELQQSNGFSSELVRLVLAHCSANHIHSLNSDVKGNAGVSSASSELFHQIMAREQDASKVKKKYSNLIAAHQQLRKDYQKLIAVTKELTTGLEMVAKATAEPSELAAANQIRSIQWDSILGSCTKIYPELFPPQTKSAIGRRDFPKMNESVLQQATNLGSVSSPSSQNVSPQKSVPSSAASNSHFSRAHERVISVIREKRLNFEKIKEDLLIEEASRRKLLLMQALRWMLTRSANGERKIVLESYLASDLLGFHENQSSMNNQKSLKLRDRIVTYFLPSDAALWSSDDSRRGNSTVLLQQACMSRLVNAMASLKKGRDYLGEYDQLIEALIDCLLVLGTKRQKQTVEMIVATLQKLSLKCLVRKKMIERGIIEWLIGYLKEFESVNSYGLEYSTALFMNLCLHKSAKEKCIPMATTILEILTKLVTTCSKQILPYVNGSLYSLLSHNQIAEEAKGMGLDKRLEESKRFGDKEMRKQLSFLLDQIQNSSNPSTSSSDVSGDDVTSSISDMEDDESIDEDIEIEDEIDIQDPVQANSNEISGPILLDTLYVIEDEREEILFIDHDHGPKTPVSRLKTPQVVSRNERNVSKSKERQKSPESVSNSKTIAPHSVSSDEGVVLVSQNSKREQQTNDSNAKESPDPGLNASNHRRASTSTYTKEEIFSLDQHIAQQNSRSSQMTKSDSFPSVENNPQSGSSRSNSGPSLNPSVPLPPVARQQSKDGGVSIEDRTKKRASVTSVVETDQGAIESKKVLPPLQSGNGPVKGKGPTEGVSRTTARAQSRGRQKQHGDHEQQTRPARSQSRGHSGEKRPLSMSFPYNPLSQGDWDDILQLASTAPTTPGSSPITCPPSPRKRWRRLPAISLAVAVD